MRLVTRAVIAILLVVFMTFTPLAAAQWVVKTPVTTEQLPPGVTVSPKGGCL